MVKKQVKSTVPLILILLGGLLILGAILVIMFRPQGAQEATQSTPIPTNSSEIARVQPEEAKNAFDSGDAVFVDVRPEESYSVSHIPGALSIPLNELPARMDELDQEDWIILY